MSFKVKNFYSIADSIEMDFTVTKNNPKGFSYVDTGNTDYDRRGSLMNVMIGPNAAGKTNVVKAISALKHLITDSQSDPDGAGLYYYRPHMLHADQPTELGAKFSINRRIFEYNFVLNTDRILKEEFIEYSKDAARFTAKKIFSRIWDREKKVYDARFYHKEMYIDILPKDLRSNASIISIAKQLPRYGFAQMIADYWKKNITSNMMFTKWGPEPDPNRVEVIDQMVDNESLKNRVNELLRKLDVGYNDVERRNLELNGQRFYTYLVSHVYSGKKFSTMWQEESSGTRRLVTILTQALTAMSVKDGVVVIDELDSDLHPDLVEAFVELFRDGDTNANRTQLIFNTHDHRVLSSLDKQQIFLTEKNDFGDTEIWRLDEVEGVRSDDNYYAKYMAGAYAARARI